MPRPCPAPIAPCPSWKSAWWPEISELLVQQCNGSYFLYCAATTIFLVHDKRCLVSHWPPASETGMCLITTYVELRVVAGRSRKRAGSPQAVSRRTCCAVALRRTAWSEHGMASVNQTRPNSVNQMGKTCSKPLAARHDRGKAWARHGHGMLCVNRP